MGVPCLEQVNTYTHVLMHARTHVPNTVKFSLIRCTDKPEVRKGYKLQKLLLPNIRNRFSKTRNPYLENHGRQRRLSNGQTESLLLFYTD